MPRTGNVALPSHARCSGLQRAVFRFSAKRLIKPKQLDCLALHRNWPAQQNSACRGFSRRRLTQPQLGYAFRPVLDQPLCGTDLPKAVLNQPRPETISFETLLLPNGFHKGMAGSASKNDSGVHQPSFNFANSDRPRLEFVANHLSA